MEKEKKEKKEIKVFLDDIRSPQDCLSYMHTRIGALNPIYAEEWVIVRNFSEFCKIVIENYKIITHISFDHDLSDFHYEMTEQDYTNLSEEEMMNKFGSVEKTGYDCAKWLKYFYISKKKNLPIMFIHSMNPIGTENIKNVFK